MLDHVPRAEGVELDDGEFDESFDVVVVGYGFAGGVAAIEAADHGAKVLICEKMPLPGGHPSTLERFQTIIRRVAAKDDDGASLVTEIACVVGAEILEGMRSPGSDLNSVELARRFRTSRTPTREAVVILEKEGLVEILPRRRPRVADLSIDEIREIYRVRAAMLGLIGSRAIT